jgi:AcrR family transcriptional regulator
MGLLEEHKSERKSRILAAARKLIADKGYEALSMRTLAHASRVSVPTLYNLFGSKHAILAAEMQETFANIARALATVPSGDAIDRAAALLEAGLRNMLDVPDYNRALVHIMLSHRETDPIRHDIEDRYIDMMAANLAAGQADGELADWFDSYVLARQMFATFMTSMLGWASGDLDDDDFRNAAAFGQSLLLLGVARGECRSKLEQRIRRAQQRFKRR